MKTTPNKPGKILTSISSIIADEVYMSNTTKKYNKLTALFMSDKKKLLNIFCTAGYPHLESTKEVILSLQKHGADMIEIGMPYSDPIADGPVIQQSNMIALQNGMTIQILLQQIMEIKAHVSIPIILMGYLNPVLQYGIEKFCAGCHSAGVDGIILPDLPMIEFKDHYQEIFIKYSLHVIFLITPETPEKRIKKADRVSSGFLYALSSSGTTGNAKVGKLKMNYLERLEKMNLKNPVMIGFGINDKKSFDEACAHSRGAIIGSAYIKALGNGENIDKNTSVFIKSIISNT